MSAYANIVSYNSVKGLYKKIQFLSFSTKNFQWSHHNFLRSKSIEKKQFLSRNQLEVYTGTYWMKTWV